MVLGRCWQYFASICNLRGMLTSGVLLQHDNARPHSPQHRPTNSATWLPAYLTPPYSPDLAPSDYYLFGEMAKRTRGKYSENIQHLSGDLGRGTKDVGKEWFRAGILQLQDRWGRCIEKKGVYMEAQDI